MLHEGTDRTSTKFVYEAREITQVVRVQALCGQFKKLNKNIYFKKERDPTIVTTLNMSDS